jgi:hypothetical protein
LSIAAAAIGWCVALVSALVLTRHRFQRVLKRQWARRARRSAQPSLDGVPNAYRRVV